MSQPHSISGSCTHTLRDGGTEQVVASKQGLRDGADSYASVKACIHLGDMKTKSPPSYREADGQARDHHSPKIHQTRSKAPG